MIFSAVYNTDVQGEAENILSSRLDNAKVRPNMAEMQHSWGSIIPLTKFNVIPDDKLFLINEDPEILNNRASISSSPMNKVHTVDYTTFSTDSCYKGRDSMLPEDNVRFRGFLALQIPEKYMVIPNALTENLEISDPVTNNSLLILQFYGQTCLRK